MKILLATLLGVLLSGSIYSQNFDLYHSLLSDTKNYLDSVEIGSKYYPKKLIIRNNSCILPFLAAYTFPDSLEQEKNRVIATMDNWTTAGIVMPPYKKYVVVANRNGRNYDACIITPIPYGDLIYTGIMYKSKKDFGGHYLYMLYSKDNKLISLKKISISSMQNIGGGNTRHLK